MDLLMSKKLTASLCISYMEHLYWLNWIQTDELKLERFSIAAGKHSLPVRRRFRDHRQPDVLIPSGMREEVPLPCNKVLPGRDRSEALHGRHCQRARDHPEHAARGRGRAVLDLGIGLADEVHVIVLEHHHRGPLCVVAYFRQWSGGQWHPLRDGGSSVALLAPEMVL